MKQKRLQFASVIVAALIIAIGASASAMAQSSAATPTDEAAASAEAEDDGIVHEFEGEEVGENGDGIPGPDEATEAEEAEEAEEPEEAIPADAASLTEDEAVTIAGAEAQGSVTGVELDDEDGTIVYEVEFDSDTEVAVDANTGDVVKVESGDNENEGGRED